MKNIIDIISKLIVKFKNKIDAILIKIENIFFKVKKNGLVRSALILLRILAQLKPFRLFFIFMYLILKYMTEAINYFFNNILMLNFETLKIDLKNLKNSDKEISPIHNLSFLDIEKIQIKLPEMNMQRFKELIEISKHERLLRKIIMKLIEDDVFKNKIVIDMGSWLGDNALPWAKLLPESLIYAIDPSSDNNLIVSNIAKFNNIKNIKIIEAACADKELIVGSESGLNMASFRENLKGIKKCFIKKTTTLDNLIPLKHHKKIGLIHLDVEGMEFKCIKGANSLINKSKPIIVFESHISREDPRSISKYLFDYKYKTYMINEVTEAKSKDCRNFIAIHEEQISNLKIYQLESKNAYTEGIFSATLGSSLIPI